MQNRRKAANKRARLPWKALMCKAKTFTLLEQLKQSEKVIRVGSDNSLSSKINAFCHLTVV